MFRTIKKILKSQLRVGLDNKSNRENWLKETLLKIPPDHLILDVGAGELQYKKFCSHLKYISQDFARYDGAGNEAGLQTGSWDNSQLDIISDITNIPLEKESVDAVMCIEVLEHVPDAPAALLSLDRVLKKNGYLIITSPFASLTHFAPFHFSTGFNKYFYQEHLARLGYQAIEITSNGTFYDFLAQELFRIRDISLLYNKKKISLFQQVVIFFMLRVLQKLNKGGAKSDELLTFGYHVFARKG